MAKLPKRPPKLPAKPSSPPPPRAAPRFAAPTPQPRYAPSTPTYTSPAPPDIKKIWDDRPRLSDLPKLTPEQQSSPAHTARVNRWRQIPVLICGFAAFGMGLYATQIYISLSKETDGAEIPVNLIDRFDKEADGYDEKVGMAETMLLLNMRRKAMTKKVKGHVLEVAVGTGRNFTYYPTKQCDTVTLLDASAPMLAVAKRKWKDVHPEYFSRVFFKQQSAVDPITPPFGAQDGFDTVLQTMGLCSTPEPIALLKNLEAATKEDGTILLLEHGRSHYDWLNSLLDKTAPGHANEHGCWWNKDVGKIVEESGLEVVQIKRYNLGTTWWVELKPRKGVRRRMQDLAQEAKEDIVRADEAATAAVKKSWGSFWG